MLNLVSPTLPHVSLPTPEDFVFDKIESTKYAGAFTKVRLFYANGCLGKQVIWVRNSIMIIECN